HIVIPPDQRVAVYEGIRPPPLPPVVGGVATGMPAYKAGIKEGDRIIAVEGRPIRTWEELPLAFRGQVDRPVRITIERESRRFDVTVKPMDPEGKGRENGRIGVEPPRRN